MILQKNGIDGKHNTLRHIGSTIKQKREFESNLCNIVEMIDER